MKLDAKEIQELYREMMLRADTKRPWLLGLLPHTVRTDYYKKGADDWLTVPNMASASLGVMPQVNAGVAPVTLSRPDIKFGEVKFAHFDAKFDLDVENFERAQRTINLLNNNQMTGTDAIDVLEELYAKDFTIARVMYNNALSLMLYKLVSDGEIDIIDDVHNNAYKYTIDGYSASSLTMPKADFLADPINKMMLIIDAALKRGKVTSLLLGDNIASELIRSEWAQKNMATLGMSGFNYRPINVFGATDFETKALGVVDITDVGGITVRRVSCRLDLPNGTSINAFNPDAIVAIAENDFGALYTRPTTRFVEDGKAVSDTGDMSYYLDSITSKAKTHRTEGYYVTGITKPNNLLRVKLTA
jgi:hypothetical protein